MNLPLLSRQGHCCEIQMKGSVTFENRKAFRTCGSQDGRYVGRATLHQELRTANCEPGSPRDLCISYLASSLYSATALHTICPTCPPIVPEMAIILAVMRQLVEKTSPSHGRDGRPAVTQGTRWNCQADRKLNDGPSSSSERKQARLT